jgi:hypothetical protein
MIYRLPNKAPQRTAADHRGCKHSFSAPLSLSLSYLR